jgi:hypothetical protein
LRIASMIRYRIFSVRSHHSLMTWYLLVVSTSHRATHQASYL